MKRSEVLKIVDEYTAGVAAQASAEELLRRLEGPLSIDYDPEEKPLPERLRNDLGLLQYFLENTWWTVAGQKSEQAIEPPVRFQLVLDEAVRRWNAWPEVRRLVDQAAWPPSSIKRAILAILDGKEGE
jgi:hypothetical protein